MKNNTNKPRYSVVITFKEWRSTAWKFECKTSQEVRVVKELIDDTVKTMEIRDNVTDTIETYMI